MTSCEIVEADLNLVEHQRAIVQLIDAYAQDPMGNGRPLPAEVRDALIPGLRAHPTTHVLLAYRGGEPVGIAVCFRGFSTFGARPLLNVHDLAVLPAHRGCGIGRRLLEAVERKARALGCARLTLEVLEKNPAARRLYTAVGFGDGNAGGVHFLSKPL